MKLQRRKHWNCWAR